MIHYSVQISLERRIGNTVLHHGILQLSHTPLTSCSNGWQWLKWWHQNGPILFCPLCDQTWLPYDGTVMWLNMIAIWWHKNGAILFCVTHDCQHCVLNFITVSNTKLFRPFWTERQGLFCHKLNQLGGLWISEVCCNITRLYVMLLILMICRTLSWSVQMWLKLRRTWNLFYVLQREEGFARVSSDHC